jgi:hypothetical protein
LLVEEFISPETLGLRKTIPGSERVQLPADLEYASFLLIG